LQSLGKEGKRDIQRFLTLRKNGASFFALKARSILALHRTGEPPTTNTRVLQIDGPSLPTETLAVNVGDHREDAIGVCRDKSRQKTLYFAVSREIFCVLLLQMSRTSSQQPLLVRRALTQDFPVVLGRKFQGPVVSCRNTGVYLTPSRILTATLRPDFCNSDFPRELLPMHIKPLPKKSESRDTLLMSMIGTTGNLIDKMSGNRGFGQTKTFPFSPSNMNSEQKSYTRTK